MIKTKHLLLIFIPALVIVGVALFIRVIQYRPLYPSEADLAALQQTGLQIPILPADPILGNKKARITIIAFEDVACPACKQQSEILKELMTKYPNDVKVVWKGLPVTTFPFNSRPAHLAAFCAHEQGLFESFQSFAFANSENLSPTIVNAIVEQLPNVQKNAFTTCLNSGKAETYVTQTEDVARSLGIQSVPTFFINNIQINPPQSVEGWATSLGL